MQCGRSGRDHSQVNWPRYELHPPSTSSGRHIHARTAHPQRRTTSHTRAFPAPPLAPNLLLSSPHTLRRRMASLQPQAEHVGRRNVVRGGTAWSVARLTNDRRGSTVWQRLRPRQRMNRYSHSNQSLRNRTQAMGGLPSFKCRQDIAAPVAPSQQSHRAPHTPKACRHATHTLS